jgi:hypothetical protein
MKKPKEKLTNKEMTSIMTNMAMRLEQCVQMVINGDRLLNEYIEFSGTQEEFKAFLQEKLDKHDNDTEKTEDK